MTGNGRFCSSYEVSPSSFRYYSSSVEYLTGICCPSVLWYILLVLVHFFRFNILWNRPQNWDIVEISSYSLTFVVFGIWKLLISARYHTWFKRVIILLKNLYIFSRLPLDIIYYVLCARVWYLKSIFIDFEIASLTCFKSLCFWHSFLHVSLIFSFNSCNYYPVHKTIINSKAILRHDFIIQFAFLSTIMKNKDFIPKSLTQDTFCRQRVFILFLTMSCWVLLLLCMQFLFKLIF